MLYGFPTTLPEVLVVTIGSFLAALALLIASKILFSRTSFLDAFKFGVIVNVAYYILRYFLDQMTILLVEIDLLFTVLNTYTVVVFFVWFASSKLIEEINTTDAIIGFVFFWLFTNNSILNLNDLILSFLLSIF